MVAADIKVRYINTTITSYCEKAKKAKNAADIPLSKELYMERHC